MTWKPDTSKPLTEREMIDLWKGGETVSRIAALARRQNGLSKDQVRTILFGKP